MSCCWFCLLSNFPDVAFPTVLTSGRPLEHNNYLLTCLSLTLITESGSHRRIFGKAWERKVSTEEESQNGNEVQASLHIWQLKSDSRPRSSCPVELCSLHYGKRGCNSFHVPPTMQIPSAQWGLSCLGNLAISLLWSFLVLSCLKKSVLHNVNVFSNTAHYSWWSHMDTRLKFASNFLWVYCLLSSIRWMTYCNPRLVSTASD